MTDDRTPFREARDAGLKARHEQRLARAQSTGPAAIHHERICVAREAYQATLRANDDGLPWNNPWAAAIAALDAFDQAEETP